MTEQEKLELNSDVANAARFEAQNSTSIAINNFFKAIAEDIKAQAKYEASKGKTYQGFLECCISNAHLNNAGWSGGPHTSSNVIEAIVREAWLNASNDMEIRNFFKH